MQASVTCSGRRRTLNSRGRLEGRSAHCAQSGRGCWHCQLGMGRLKGEDSLQFPEAGREGGKPGLSLLHSAVELLATSLPHDLVLVAWSACRVLPDNAPTVGADNCKYQLQILTPAIISRIVKPLCFGYCLRCRWSEQAHALLSAKSRRGNDGKGYSDGCRVLSYACRTGLWPCCICMSTLLSCLQLSAGDLRGRTGVASGQAGMPLRAESRM